MVTASWHSATCLHFLRLGLKEGARRYRDKLDLDFDRQISTRDIVLALSQLGRHCA